MDKSFLKVCVLSVVVMIAGCGGGGGGGGTAASSASAQGVATPNSVSVVTAK